MNNIVCSGSGIVFVRAKCEAARQNRRMNGLYRFPRTSPSHAQALNVTAFLAEEVPTLAVMLYTSALYLLLGSAFCGFGVFLLCAVLGADARYCMHCSYRLSTMLVHKFVRLCELVDKFVMRG